MDAVSRWTAGAATGHESQGAALNADERARLEKRIREAHEGGDLEGAATAALRGYGPEILGFLLARVGEPTRAAEAFSQFSEDLWRGLPTFAWRSSFRTWAYALSRHAAIRCGKVAWVRKARPLVTAEIGRIADEVCESTLRYLGNTADDQVALLRNALEPHERELLVLRVDRRLSWSEIAEITSGTETAAQGAELQKRAASLRKQYQRITARLRADAQAAGLLGKSS